MTAPLLVFDCHEAWVYQLGALGLPLEIIVGLHGRHTETWDENMRPVPPNARLVRLEEALRGGRRYECVVCHNLTDLLDSKTIDAPRLLMIHETLDSAMREQRAGVSPGNFRAAVARFVEVTGTHVVAISKLKGRSWGFEEDIVPSAVNPSDYVPWKGTLASGLRVANHIHRRPHTLLWEFHQQAFADLPMTIVGHNPDMPGVLPSANWSNLKEKFSAHRFYVHTADPTLEDGYNLATLEAMAAGLPVLGNRNPTSPIEHDVSGFLSDDPKELRSYAVRLLEDRELAHRMGQAARKAVAERFSPMRFKRDFLYSITLAETKRETRRRSSPLVVCHS
jgi:hypothetical protein